MNSLGLALMHGNITVIVTATCLQLANINKLNAVSLKEFVLSYLTEVIVIALRFLTPAFV